MKTSDEEMFVGIYGENHRKLIRDALRFFNANRTRWKLKTPFNKANYIRELVEKADGKL